MTSTTPTACRRTVSGLFHSPPGVLFTFPSRYWFTIGGNAYLALAGGPARFPQGFSCPVVLGVSLPPLSSFDYAPLTLYGTAFQPSSSKVKWIWNAPRPRTQKVRFRLLRFRSPLLPESRLFSSPRRTKMFQFRRCPLPSLWIQEGVTAYHGCRVSPFGFPRIIACLQLPVAFRRWPRPSSARCPKASTMRPS